MSVDQEMRSVQAVSQTVASKVLGFKSPGSLRALRDAPRSKAGAYDLTVLVPWYLHRSTGTPADSPSDAMAQAPADCPHAVRWRRERANQAEIKTAQMRGELVPIAFVHDFHMQAASIIRKAGERLYREHGQAAGRVLDDALVDFTRVLSMACASGGEWAEEHEEAK